MRSKLSWVTFIPLTLVACFCKTARYFLPEGAVFGLTDLQMDYFFLAAVVLIFLLSLLFCLIDRRISTYYLPHRNIPAGIIGIAAALIFAGQGADGIFRIISSGSFDALSVIDSVLLLLTAVVFVILGLTHSLRNGAKRFVLLNIIPALFFAERMIACFVSFTTISLKLADVSKLACYVFATLFFFNYAVALSLTKTKNAVKSCFIFGFPTVASMLVYGAAKLIFDPDVQSLVNNAEALEMILISAYVLAFLIELTIYIPDKDDVIVVEDEEAQKPEESVGGFVVKITDEEAHDKETASSYLATADTDDFLYQEVKNDEDADAAVSNDVEGYLTTTDEDNEYDDRPADYESKLDRIDKLILEISEKSD